LDDRGIYQPKPVCDFRDELRDFAEILFILALILICKPKVLNEDIPVCHFRQIQVLLVPHLAVAMAALDSVLD
jgi:hypothetical protein